MRSVVLATSVLAVSLTAACSGPSSPEQSLIGMGDSVSDLFSGHTNAPTQTIRFATAGVVSVDVDTFAGDVVVVATPNAKEMVVTVEREGTHGHFRGGESRDSLDHIDATAALRPGTLGAVLHVRAATTDAEPHFQRAHVRIDAPDVDGVRVRTGRGGVKLINVTGPVDVEASRGDVRVMSERPLVAAVTVLNVGGDIDYRVDGRSSGLFDIETIGGKISYRIADGNWHVVKPTTFESGRLQGQLGDGGNPVVLRTTDGEIRLAVVENPTAVGAIILDP